MICNTLLDIVKTIYPLEQRRIKIAQTCAKPIKSCPEHKETLNTILIVNRSLSLQMLTQSKTPQSNI